jgi:5'-deoxynucleotidase YfbR-like HD superfamily hydrolase
MKAARKSPPGVRGSTILTASGRYVDLIKPKVEMVTPFDIAVGLSNTCRFGGHTSAFYSVAQHCVLVSQLVPPHLALQGLLHDAAEAYIGDVVSPLKQHLPEFKVIEHRLEAVIARAFGLRFPWAPQIKTADLRALRFEREQLMHPAGGQFSRLEEYEPVPGTLTPLPPHEAAKEWLYRFAQLRGKP